ncbi:MAG: flagellar hook-length control protein FliK [Defluviitaleaceae bacterium]|nr:flagellar hook-length control protein FliK [Defluviitaleaceae bacterium]MCL2261772.1 flagellar hook-length control protein FliK [Defluviitaleaceae bacterium]
MKIFEPLNSKLPEAVAKSPKGNAQAQSNAAFDMLFTEAERRQSFDPSAETRNRDDNRGRNRTNETRRDDQPTRRREEPRHDDMTNPAGAAVVQEQQQNLACEANVSDENVAVNEEEAVTKVAEAMKVPKEEVIELLEELGMEAADLTDAQAVAKMLQTALDAENTAELLTDPKFPEMYKAVNEAMAEVAAKATKGETVLVSKEAVETLAEVEATVEDGEIVVEARDTDENAEGSLRQQSAETQEEIPQEAAPANEQPVDVTNAKPLTADEAVFNESQALSPAFNVETIAAKAEQTAVKQNAPQQPVNPQDVIDQIMNQVKLVSSGGQFSEIRMTLKPETLGDIVLRVITHNGIIMAQFEAENQRVKEALESDFNSLRNALEEQGLKFSELSVSVRQDANERANQFERARQNSRNRAESVEDVSEEAEQVSYHNGVIDVTA